MKYLILAIAVLTLSACDSPQEAIDKAEMICKDGVQYFSYEKMNTNGDVSFSVVPHFKADGSLYTCDKLNVNSVTDVTEVENVQSN